MKLGIIARADLTGLGNQSRNWVRLLNPHKVIIIDSRPFNNNEQHLEWYANCRNTYLTDGFIKSHEINSILKDIDVLLTFEIPYNYELIAEARRRGIKTIIQNNWEFTDYLQNSSLPLPDLLVNHSYWNLEKQRELWPAITEYCPTPLFVKDYDEIMLQNMDRQSGKPRFLHVAGRKTYEDRNGTKDLMKAVLEIPPYIDFELVIKTQTAETSNIIDSRITIDTSSPVDEKELYRNFDAMILPRRYGGACMPMSEALMAGLPVIMTDIDPNNKVLPRNWLVRPNYEHSFMARTEVPIYSADPLSLERKITEFATSDLLAEKLMAREIAIREYSEEAVKDKWSLLMTKLGVQ